MASPPILDDPNHSARRAKTRIAVAVVLLAIAIGGLTLLSRQQQPIEKAEAPVAQKQESISSGENPVPNREPAPAQINSATQEAPLAPPTPAEPAAAPVTPPPPPQVTNPQPINNTPSPAPSVKTPGKISPVPSEPVSPIEKPIEKAPLAATATKPSELVTHKSSEAPAPAAPAKAGPPPKSYDVQVGVFTDMDNAKQLQAKLAEYGIPSHTETKLQVGPFNTKAEAEAAREKLKNLGIGSVVIPGK